MTLKRKPNSNSLVDGFFNTILFVKRYTFETSLPIDIAMIRLYELSDEKHGWLNRKSRYTVESVQFNKDHEFDIRAKDRQHQYTITHATGLAHSTDTGDTLIEGEIRFGVVYFFMLMLSILWMFFVIQFVGVHLPIWMIAFLMIMPTFTFVHMIYKRNQLINKIQSAITPRFDDGKFDELKQRKGLNEIYAELELQFANMRDDSSEQEYHDQQ